MKTRTHYWSGLHLIVLDETRNPRTKKVDQVFNRLGTIQGIIYWIKWRLK